MTARSDMTLMLDEIRNGIFVGDIRDARMDGGRMDAVVTLCDEKPPTTTHYEPIDDGKNKQEEFDGAVETAKRAVSNNQMTLVHCASGRSRSVSVVAVIIAERENLSFDEALNEVKQQRRRASPSFHVEQHARSYLGEPVETLEGLISREE